MIRFVAWRKRLTGRLFQRSSGPKCWQLWGVSIMSGSSMSLIPLNSLQLSNRISWSKVETGPSTRSSAARWSKLVAASSQRSRWFLVCRLQDSFNVSAQPRHNSCLIRPLTYPPGSPHFDRPLITNRRVCACSGHMARLRLVPSHCWTGSGVIPTTSPAHGS